jgi:hypothetical protein
MKLLADTQAILQRVEEVTGIPVEIIQDADQPHLARVTRARAGIPAHILRVNPTLGAPDYLIAYQCGFLLRLYDTPIEGRRDFAGTAEGRTEVERLVKRAGQTVRLPNAVLPQLVEQFLTGILFQVRSYPIGMRIDAWIHETYPALDSVQREGVTRQQKDNSSVLRPDVKRIAPKPIYDANATMNAAYAIFCDRVFGKAGYSIPYRSAGYEKRGRALLDIWESVPDDPEHDRVLVDAWATELGLAGWYQWVPLQS